MNDKVKSAVASLNKILPLSEHQKKLNTEAADLYQAILRSFIDHGRSPGKDELMEMTEHIDEVLDTLKKNDMVVFDDDGEIIGAYPFTMEKRIHSVRVNGHRIHAMCALDALAISPMFHVKTHIDSVCEVSGEAVSIDQYRLKADETGGNDDLHFGINWNAAKSNCCATSLCTEMIFLIDTETAQTWRSADMEHREIFTLEEAINFSAQFFTPLIDDSDRS